MELEYCVMMRNFPDEPWRGPWPEADCRKWVQDALDDGFVPGAFYVASRRVERWSKHETPLGLFDCVCITKDDTHSAACARHNSLPNWQRPKRQNMSSELEDSMAYPANKPKRHPDYNHCHCPDTLTHRAAVRTADLSNQANGLDWEDF